MHYQLTGFWNKILLSWEINENNTAKHKCPKSSFVVYLTPRTFNFLANCVQKLRYMSIDLRYMNGTWMTSHRIANIKYNLSGSTSLHITPFLLPWNFECRTSPQVFVLFCIMTEELEFINKLCFSFIQELFVSTRKLVFFRTANSLTERTINKIDSW